MAWLVVLGAGSWTDRDGTRWTAGAHEVNEDVAQWAQDSGLAFLVVTEREPVISAPSAALTLDDVMLGSHDAGVSIVEEPGEEPLDVENLLDVPLSHPCRWCPWRSPSNGALVRHIEMHHDVAVSVMHDVVKQAAPPEPEPLPEGVNPDDPSLHPFERVSVT